MRFSAKPLNAVRASTAAPINLPISPLRAAAGLGLQILDAQDFHAVNDACGNPPDLAGVAEPNPGQQLP